MPVIPDTAKQPQDHLPPTTDDAPSPDRVVTVRGHEWVIPAEALEDFELLDDLDRLGTNRDGTRLPAILRRLLPPLPSPDGALLPIDQWRAAMDVLRSPNGRVLPADGEKFIAELLEELNPNS